MTDEVFHFLTKPRATASQIREKRDRLEALRSSVACPAAIRYDKDRVQSYPENKLERVFGEIDELEREIGRLQHRYRKEIGQISATIRRLEDERECRVLLLRYVRGVPFRSIASSMEISLSSVFRLHRRGTGQLAELVTDSGAERG